MLTRADIKRIKEDRGNLDLTKQIEDLQAKCRHAGSAILELNAKYESALKEIDRLSEENRNLTLIKKP